MYKNPQYRIFYDFRRVTHERGIFVAQSPHIYNPVESALGTLFVVGRREREARTRVFAAAGERRLLGFHAAFPSARYFISPRCVCVCARAGIAPASRRRLLTFHHLSLSHIARDYHEITKTRVTSPPRRIRIHTENSSLCFFFVICISH